MMRNTEHIFCPKCKSFALENECNEGLEWVSNDEIGAEETYVCSNCGRVFTVATTYTMTKFIFLNEDADDVEYNIVEED